VGRLHPGLVDLRHIGKDIGRDAQLRLLFPFRRQAAFVDGGAVEALGLVQRIGRLRLFGLRILSAFKMLLVASFLQLDLVGLAAQLQLGGDALKVNCATTYRFDVQKAQEVLN
jgi:hypothetical protein